MMSNVSNDPDVVAAEDQFYAAVDLLLSTSSAMRWVAAGGTPEWMVALDACVAAREAVRVARRKAHRRAAVQWLRENLDEAATGTVHVPPRQLPPMPVRIAADLLALIDGDPMEVAK